MSFRFDEQGFRKVVQVVVHDQTKKVQAVFDSVGSQKGRPVAAVKAKLRSEASRKGYRFPEQDLTTYATALSKGNAITAKPG